MANSKACRQRSVIALIIVCAVQLVLICTCFILVLHYQSQNLKTTEQNEKDKANLREELARLKSFYSVLSDNRDSETKKTPLNQKKLGTKNAGDFFAEGQNPRQKASRKSGSGNHNAISCPFRRPRRKVICSFVQNEVSKQSNISKDWMTKELKKLRSELQKLESKLNDTLDNQDVGAHLHFKRRNVVRFFTRANNARYYSLSWDKIRPNNCLNLDKANVEELHACRNFRISSRRFEPDKHRTEMRHIGIKIAGNYLLSCQLVMELKNSPLYKFTNVADLIAQVSILSSREKPLEHMELLSQVLVKSELIDGNSHATLYTVSMTGQAYLYKGSKIRVVVMFKKNEGLPADDYMGLTPRYNHLQVVNWFDIRLLNKKDDSRG